jgi:glucosamine--fructose-6-phosphate aminotransferase (isomerizing)
MAMEGALKLKEISYIHAEGYPAGEMKHGPISLIDSNLPIIALIPKDPLYEKMLSSISEAKARGGSIISIASDSDTSIKEISSQVVRIPDASEFITPMLMATPLQLISYHIAIKRGCNIDQPRNLAKSVTVE